MDRNILVVGDTSYVGKHLLHYLHSRGVNAVGTSRHTSDPRLLFGP